MNNTLSEEQQKILNELGAAGWNPRLCDTPVPYIDANVMAGIPTMPGDYIKGEYVMLPRDLMGMEPTFIVNVKGNSMCDADIKDGDQLYVKMGVEVRDGDIVVAAIDGEYTVKAYCEDEHGGKWLVPSNEEYNAIRLTENMNIRIIGRVLECIKQAPRCSYSEMMKSIKRTRLREAANQPKKVSEEKIAKAIVEVQPLITQKGHWLAVYRILADRDIIRMYSELASYVHQSLGIAVEQLSKPIDASIIGKTAINKGLTQGKSFDDWKKQKAKKEVAPFYEIAKKFKELADL